jgi:hypothetical protein
LPISRIIGSKIAVQSSNLVILFGAIIGMAAILLNRYSRFSIAS